MADTDTPTPLEDLIAGDAETDERAYVFRVHADEIFHITHEGEFIFAEGVKPEEAARTFARHFRDEFEKLKPTDAILGYVNFQTGTFRPSLDGLPDLMAKRYKAVVEAP